MPSEFLANLHQEGERIDEFPLGELENEEKETPPAPPAETKPKEETAPPAEEKAEGEPEPKKGEEVSKEKPEIFHAFHEHPRWIARDQELKELREQNEELMRFQERAEPLLKKVDQIQPKEGIPAEFRALYGEDENAWTNFQALTERQQERLLAKFEDRIKPLLDTVETVKRKTELDDWAEKEWKSIEDDPQVKSELKRIGKELNADTQSEISQIVSKYLPTDEITGKISLRKGFELWKELKSAPKVVPNPVVNEKKQIADKTIKKSKGEEGEKDYRTSADFRGKTFADLTPEL